MADAELDEIETAGDEGEMRFYALTDDGAVAEIIKGDDGRWSWASDGTALGNERHRFVVGACAHLAASGFEREIRDQLVFAREHGRFPSARASA